MIKKVSRASFKTVFSILIFLFVISFTWRNHSITYENVKKVEFSPFKPWYFKNGSLRPQYGAKSLKLWPNEAAGDRILNQLMFIPEKEPEIKKKIYLPKLQNTIFQEGSQIFHDLNCPVKNCEVVFNRNVADAVVFENFVTRVRKHSFNQIWILHSLESPLFSGKAIQQTSVNWTASYRLDSDIVTPYDKWVYYDENNKVKPPERNYAAGKNKKVAWFVSNCQAKNKRLEYAKMLGKFIPVDIYGNCGDKVCHKTAGDYCQKVVSKNYKFYLSFENANCRDYITEKFYKNALRLDVVPIVMGAPKQDYEKVAPLNSFIHVEDFATPKHLADYLHHLDKNDEEYNAYFSWKEAGEFINTYFLCRLCAMLHAGRNDYFYEKINHWWRGPEVCTKTFWNSTNRGTILKSLKRVYKDNVNN